MRASVLFLGGQMGLVLAEDFFVEDPLALISTWDDEHTL